MEISMYKLATGNYEISLYYYKLHNCAIFHCIAIVFVTESGSFQDFLVFCSHIIKITTTVGFTMTQKNTFSMLCTWLYEGMALMYLSKLERLFIRPSSILKAIICINMKKITSIFNDVNFKYNNVWFFIKFWKLSVI